MTFSHSRLMAIGAGLLLASVLAASSASALKPSAAIQQRIDALLKHRLRPEPLPIDPPNPFQVTSAGIRDVSVDGTSTKPGSRGQIEANANLPASLATGEATLGSSAEVLAGCVARLKIGGLIRMRDQIQIVVNDVPRREGDVIVIDWNNTAIPLRVVRVLSNQLTLRYGDADVILKY